MAETDITEAMRDFVIAHCRERAVIQRCMDVGDGNVSAADAAAPNLIVDREHMPQSVMPIEQWPHNADGTVQPPGPEAT